MKGNGIRKKSHYNPDSLTKEKKDYLQSLEKLSGDFEQMNSMTGKFQDQPVSIQLMPLFNFYFDKAHFLFNVFMTPGLKNIITQIFRGLQLIMNYFVDSVCRKGIIPDVLITGVTTSATRKRSTRATIRVAFTSAVRRPGCRARRTACRSRVRSRSSEVKGQEDSRGKLVVDAFNPRPDMLASADLIGDPPTVEILKFGPESELDRVVGLEIAGTDTVLVVAVMSNPIHQRRGPVQFDDPARIRRSSVSFALFSQRTDRLWQPLTTT